MTPREAFHLAKQVLLLVVIVGCFWVVIGPSTTVESAAAFSLLGVIVAQLVRRSDEP